MGAPPWRAGRIERRSSRHRMWLLCLAAVKPSKLPTLDAVTVAKHLWETSDLFATDVHGIVRCGPEGVPPRFRLAYMPSHMPLKAMKMLWLLCRTSCKIIAGAARRAHSAHRTPSCARRRGQHRPCWPRSDGVSALERGRALDWG